MATALEVLQATNAAFGMVCQIEQSPAGYDCPVHEVPLIAHHLETINGWNEVLACPAFDGTCRYDPDSTPSLIDNPHGPDDTAPQGPANTSGGF